MNTPYCCIHAWKFAKDMAWLNRPLKDCRCNHHEYCRFCFPPEFRNGGYWEQVKPEEPKP